MGRAENIVPLCTIGIISLSVPHQGSASADWGIAVVRMSNALGLGGDQTLLSALKAGSPHVQDMVHHFVRWVNNYNVDFVQFYETEKTSYGVRIGMRWTELVVPESSACLPGFEKIALPSNHFNMAKFKGPQDRSYLKVKSVLRRMVKNAPEKAKSRFPTQPSVQDNSLVPPMHRDCQKGLFISWPDSDLKEVKWRIGERAPTTCEWLLTLDGYATWLQGPPGQVLCLIGEAGMGKTMMTTFLIDEFSTRLKVTGNIVLTYHFCDKRNSNTNTATGIIRQMLFQIYQQSPTHFHLLQQAYDIQGHDLFGDFDTMWRICLEILHQSQDQETVLLIDGIDACDRESRRLIMAAFESISTSNINVKILATCRPEDDLEMGFRFSNTMAHRIETRDIEKDLHKYIEYKTEVICRKRGWRNERQQMITDYLLERTNGTFQPWAQVFEKLERMDKQEPPRRPDGSNFMLKDHWISLQKRLSTSRPDEKKDFYRMLDTLYDSCGDAQIKETTVLLPDSDDSRSNAVGDQAATNNKGNVTLRRPDKGTKVSELSNDSDETKLLPQQQTMATKPYWKAIVSKLLQKIHPFRFLSANPSEHDAQHDSDASLGYTDKSNESSNLIWWTVLGIIVFLAIGAVSLALGVGELSPNKPASWFTSDFYLSVSNNAWVALGIYSTFLSTLKHYKEHRNRRMWQFTWFCCVVCGLLCFSPAIYIFSPRWTQVLSGIGSIVQVLIIHLTVWNLENMHEFGSGVRREKGSFELANLNALRANGVVNLGSNGAFDILPVMSGANTSRENEAGSASHQLPRIEVSTPRQHSRAGSFVSV